jgi:Ala-tRNA(Pro) deacylase
MIGEAIMISTRLQDYLDDSDVDYSISIHRPAYTAREIAHSDHTPSRQMAKTVVFEADGAYGMALLPAHMHVDAVDLRHSLGIADLRLASESELQKLFPDVEVGAMPPFANLYGIPVYIDEHLASQHEVAFNAGSHMEAIHMKTHDLIRLSRALVIRFARLG